MRKHDARIRRPCTREFDEMNGDGAVRHCDECEKLVHNLSLLGEAKARSALEDRRGDEVCVVYLHDQRGEVIFANAAEPTALSTRSRWAGLVATAALSLAPLQIACGGVSVSQPDYAESALSPKGDKVALSFVAGSGRDG